MDVDVEFDYDYDYDYDYEVEVEQAGVFSLLNDPCSRPVHPLINRHGIFEATCQTQREAEAD